MAKISARGDREVLRATKETPMPPTDELVSRRRVEVVVTRNRRVLQKNTAWFRQDGRQHDWGWKRDTAVVINQPTVRQLAEEFLSRGWQVQVTGQFKSEEGTR